MNLHINKEEFDFLMTLKSRDYVFGSHLYGTNTENSDKDILHIVSDDWDGWVEESITLPSTLLQYKDLENNIDHIFATRTQFITNLDEGESTIYPDIIMFSGEKFWENDFEQIFTYKILKCYLGFAKRDLKQYKEGYHKLLHACRGLSIVAHILEERTLPTKKLVQKVYENEDLTVDILLMLEKVLREQLNTLFEKDEIKMYREIRPRGVEDGSVVETLYLKLINSRNIKNFTYNT